MAIFKTVDVGFVSRRRVLYPQFGMALHAGLIVNGRDADAPAMLDMASRALRNVSRDLIGVMDRPVVAQKASTVFGLRGECVGLLNVARRAFLFQHCVCLAHAA